MVPKLKLYRVDDEEMEPVGTIQQPNVTVRLGDLLPLVAWAQRHNFIWLKDFMDDEVCITEDLHQVLQNFRGCRPSA